MMEKRAFIAILLSIIIIVLYQYFFIKPPSQLPEKRSISQKEEFLKEEKTPEKDIKVEKKLLSSVHTYGEEKEVSVETDLYSMVISSRCASIKSFVLKRYNDKDGMSVRLLKMPDNLPLCIGDKDGYHPEIYNFRIIGKNLTLSSINPSGEILFSYDSGSVSIRRTYRFTYDDYRIMIKDEVKGVNGYWVTLGGDIGIFDRRESSFHVGPVILKDVDRLEYDEKDIKNHQQIVHGRINWIALEDKYFFSAIVPLKPVDTAMVFMKEKPMVSLRFDLSENEYIFYAGPKEHDRLKAYGVGLEHIIDFGFFSIVARPIFWILKGINKVVGNYGWSIVILSILIRIPFTPLITKGQKSMKKLQELQPKLEELRKRYKDDPKALQRETMELYKRYKVNPLGGCLPILIQLPVFFALYKVLSITIELRQAPFILWIHDLSQKDPYYVLPILMGITMIVQQAITPSGGDPRQKKLMLFMSGFFTILFLSFPAGLVLYWLTTNVLGIIHQYYLNTLFRRESRV